MHSGALTRNYVMDLALLLLALLGYCSSPAGEGGQCLRLKAIFYDIRPSPYHALPSAMVIPNVSKTSLLCQVKVLKNNYLWDIMREHQIRQNQ